jgi:hypothetical protein
VVDDEEFDKLIEISNAQSKNVQIHLVSPPFFIE